MTGQELYERLRSVNYVRNGRDVQKDGGLDCWGFVRVAWSMLGMPVPPPYVIDDEELRRLAFQNAREGAIWERLKRPEAWALVLLRHPSHPDHCGVVADDCIRFLHCNTNGVHFVYLDSPMLRSYQLEYYRYNV